MAELFVQYARDVEEALERLLPSKLRDVPDTLLSAMRYSLEAGGKRIRPALLLACHALTAPPEETALVFACAVEMIHTYSLIHDDLPCMDDDDMRRGKPSNHIVFGEGQAVLAGDALFSHASLIMTEQLLRLVGEARENAARAQRDILHACDIYGMVAGQCLDLENEGKPVDATLLERIQTKKTAMMLAGACSAGGWLSGAGEAASGALYAYGLALGRAFQIADDILDIVADEQRLGKPVGSDAAQGKATYPVVHGMDAAKKALYDYTEDALRALTPFGDRAEALLSLALKLRDRLY